MHKEKCRSATNDTNATSYAWRSAQNPKTSNHQLCCDSPNLLAAKSFLYLLESRSSNKKNDYTKKKNGECGFSVG